MSRVVPLLTLHPKKMAHWNRYLLDSLLALSSIILLTGLIWLFQLHQKILDYFLIYLIAILSLASLRGLYAALFASCAAFFSFDFFFVPPFYTLSVAKFEDVLTLVVFLVTAIMTSQLAAMLRQRAEAANRREREAHILYDLVRATNREEELEIQLAIFARAVISVFAPWGIRDCLLLLPDEHGRLTPLVSACRPIEQVDLSADERAGADRALKQGQRVDIPEWAITREKQSGGNPGTAPSGKSAMRRYVCMVPLKTEQKVVGVLGLLIEQDERSDTLDALLSLEQGHPTPDAVFFSTFLEQAVTVIERGHLRSESFRMKVLEQTDALRSALLSSVSHDLRTPLSTIKTSATSLLEEEVQWDEETRRGFILAIEHEADRLNSLVENLLDMSRIESGSLRPEKVWYPLDALLRDVLDSMQPLLEDRTVQLSIPDSLPPVELDAVLIEQVVTNLLTNAVNYTPAGSPIEVGIEVQEAAVVISIADRGPGIAPEVREHIFDKFYRLLGKPQTRSEAQEPRGSGLGLAICRGLVEAHGGRIWVEAREGGGAAFRFTLPLGTTGELEL